LRHYFFKEWKANLRARPLVTLLVVLLAAGGLAGAAALHSEFGRALGWWESHFAGPFIEVYLDDQLAQDVGFRFSEQLAADERVLTATYISAAEAQAEAEGYLGAMAFSVLPENPLPASIRLDLAPNAKSSAALRRLVDSLAVLPGVAEIVSADQQLAVYSQGRETLTTYARSVTIIAVVWTGLWLFWGVYLIARVRAPETRIWSCLGARPGWFRWPLISEGIALGLGTSLVAWLIPVGNDSPVSFMGGLSVGLAAGPPMIGAVAGWLAYRVQRVRTFPR
jgi:cell division transport system permease protein